MIIDPKNHGIVIATDHFSTYEGERFLLSEVLRDREVRKHVNGLWVPRHILDDDNLASEISHIAMGVGLTDYRSSKTNGLAADAEQKPKLRLIYDTSSSNSIEDSIQDIETIITKHPGPDMSFTLSPNIFGDGCRALKQYFEHRGNVNFLLTGVYPEHKSEDVLDATGMTEEDYTCHISKLADKYGMAGVVGYGGLAKYTRVGQYYLGMGVCASNAENYFKNIIVTDKNGDEKIIEIAKRMTSPEETYKHATSTEIILGRTLFTQSDGNLLLPDESKLTAEEYRDLTPVVKAGILDVAARLKSLPQPSPLPSF